jgi:hypothetical protein
VEDVDGHLPEVQEEDVLMARYVVIYEDREFEDGTIIDRGALTPWGSRLPVTYSYDHGDVIGWATDFKRDGRELSFEIAFKSPEQEAAFASAGLAAVTELFRMQGQRGGRITSGSIVSISFTQFPLGYKDNKIVPRTTT